MNQTGRKSVIINFQSKRLFVTFGITQTTSNDPFPEIMSAAFLPLQLLLILIDLAVSDKMIRE